MSSAARLRPTWRSRGVGLALDTFALQQVAQQTLDQAFGAALTSVMTAMQSSDYAGALKAAKLDTSSVDAAFAQGMVDPNFVLTRNGATYTGNTTQEEASLAAFAGGQSALDDAANAIGLALLLYNSLQAALDAAVLPQATTPSGPNGQPMNLVATAEFLYAFAMTPALAGYGEQGKIPMAFQRALWMSDVNGQPLASVPMTGVYDSATASALQSVLPTAPVPTPAAVTASIQAPPPPATSLPESNPAPPGSSQWYALQKQAHYQAQQAALLAAAAGGTAPSIAPVASIAVSGPTTVQVGQQGQLTATATMSDGTTKDVSSVATWVSNQPSVLRVAPGGVVQGLAAGSGQIGASYGGVNSPSPWAVVVTAPAGGAAGGATYHSGTTQYQPGATGATTSAASSATPWIVGGLLLAAAGGTAVYVNRKHKRGRR
jgi:hypothetical protein